MKKKYTKPTVASRTAVLGVFGDYGGGNPDGAGGGNSSSPQPYKPLTDSNLDIQ